MNVSSCLSPSRTAPCAPDGSTAGGERRLNITGDEIHFEIDRSARPVIPEPCHRTGVRNNRKRHTRPALAVDGETDTINGESESAAGLGWNTQGDYLPTCGSMISMGF